VTIPVFVWYNTGTRIDNQHFVGLGLGIPTCYTEKGIEDTLNKTYQNAKVS